jgi:antitoxin component YwqK of YwqJK toxin-antitoxin module
MLVNKYTMKKFFKILWKTILYLIIWILAVLGIFLIIVCSDNGFRICFNNNSDKYCYNFKINMNEKIYENDGNVIERNYINWIENWSIIYYYTSWNIGIKWYYENWEYIWELNGYYENWQTMANVNYVDWKENWEFKAYYENWNIRVEWNYNNWERIWIWTWYYENWDIEKVINYDNLEWDVSD